MTTPQPDLPTRIRTDTRLAPGHTCTGVHGKPCASVLFHAASRCMKCERLLVQSRRAA